jgi:hypothetical protein
MESNELEDEALQKAKIGLKKKVTLQEFQKDTIPFSIKQK